MSAKTLIAIAACMAALPPTSLLAAFYPPWLTPAATENSGAPVQPLVQSPGEYRKALCQLRSLLDGGEDASERARHRLELADGLREVGETESAMSLYEEVAAARDFPACVTGAQLGAARCRLAENRIPDMVRILDSTLPRNDRDRVLMAELQYLAGRTQTAKALLDAGDFGSSGDLNARLRAGILYRALRQYKPANAIFASFQDCNDDILKAQASQLAKLTRAALPTEFSNGSYRGSAVTADGELVLTVTVKNGKIAGVEFTGFGGGANGCMAATLAAERMVKYNNVVFDPVNGCEEFCASATVAAAKALEQARRN